ncbi:MAG: transposase [Thermoflexales bacterium]
MKQPTPNKHTMKPELLFLGLDVHAKNIAIALAAGDGGEARTWGSIPNDLHALEKILAKLKKAHPGSALRVCYEAGPTGFVLARRCAQLKIPCAVVAPSLIPSRRGDRIKTDRRDARSRAERDSQRAEPLPEGSRRRAAATWPGCTGPAS